MSRDILAIMGSHSKPLCNRQCQSSMAVSKTFIGGAVYRQFESEAPASEILDRVICNSEQFSFQMCLESMVMAAELFATGDREFQTAASWCHDAECFGVKVDPRCRLIE